MKKYQKALNLALITGFALSPLSVFALEKSETIYSNLNPDGSSYKSTVSNHLSWLETGDIEDNTELKEILNISGEETFEKNDTKLSWKSRGNDIFYQGETEKELAINTKIKYYLNDEEKQVDEIIGKAGNIKIEIEFENKLKNNINVNGSSTELYTPFVTMVGAMLNNNNKNIKISNGKVISTGSRNMVVGIASPGLYKSIGLEEFKNLDQLTITYETSSFSLNSMYIVSTPKLLEENDLAIFDKMDELYNSMYELQKNMNKLEEGAKELASGANALSQGSNELTIGIKSALDAIDLLKNGSTAIDNGLSQIITSLNTASTELNKVDLNTSVNQLNYLKSQNNTAITNLTVTNKSLKGTYDNYKSANFTEDTLKAYLASQGLDASSITQIVTIKKTYEGNQNLITLLTANNTAIDSTIVTINSMSTKLNSLLKELNNALSKLSNGSKELNNGLGNLKMGIQKIYNGSITLNNGTKSLSTGANSLSEGATIFNNQGIKKLNNYAYKLKSYSDKIEALTSLSKNYKGFTSNNSTSTNFVSVIKSSKVTYQR